MVIERPPISLVDAVRVVLAALVVPVVPVE